MFQSALIHFLSTCVLTVFPISAAMRAYVAQDFRRTYETLADIKAVMFSHHTQSLQEWSAPSSRQSSMNTFDKGDNRPNWHHSQCLPPEDKLSRWVICIAMLTVILLGKCIKNSLVGEGVSDTILSAMSPLKMVSNLSG